MKKTKFTRYEGPGLKNFSVSFTDIKNDYFIFLSMLAFGRLDDEGRQKGNAVLRRIHSKEFYELVPHDNNRGEDGKIFRELFILRKYISGYAQIEDSLAGPCTVLEMMLGVANKMSETLSVGGSMDNLFPEEGGYSREEIMLKTCFWTLMRNLGLEDIDNQKYFEPGVEEKVDDIIEVLLTRKYTYGGEGGLFPLLTSLGDQRKVEIWYQMQAYLMENNEI